MSAFSVNSMLNQASNTEQPSRPPRPSVLDISNLLCGEDLEPTLSPSSSNGSNSAIQSPVSASSGCCQLPSIMDVWPAQQLPMLPPMPSQKPLHPLEPASSSATANSIWMHHSMASSVSSVASDMSNSTSATTTNASTTSLPTNMVSESSSSSTSSTRTLPLKKQARRYYREDSTSHSSSSSDDDQEEPVSSLIPSSPSLPPVKAKRRRANAKQLQVLNRVFERTVFPSTQLRAELGRQLGMTPRTVQIWFQNRRQAIRTRERQRLLRIVSDDSSAASLSTAMD
ncbi:hypothetical protein O0I10_010084 [Lichtheimia ornata]|uniref:Homeobox domain-containing protein n=1 Tax=Lichtheimia ornata TaxID=688661 RepID=A0AAD7XY52_9FUNG|nr:uncharacterized protein O0I10_010084 [Lichtheimia ornata]KAJ8654262.1 hypothetical protein O0I10_010084 [Lichtheimia ornata]